MGESFQALEGLAITRELGHEFLSRVNPIFAELTDVEGRVSVELGDLYLPLGDEIKRSSTGRGRLDLRELKVRPKGILAALVQLGGRQSEGQFRVKAQSVDFTIREGRIYYDDFTLMLPDGFDLRFYGSVGFDDTLDLAVSVPVSLGLLERFGVSGPVIDYARILSGVRVAIPILGTRLKPRLDFSEVDIRPLIEQAASTLLTEQAGKLLEDLLGVEPSEEKAPEKPKEQKDTDAVKKDVEILLDTLFDLLQEPPRRDNPNRGIDEP
jgi:hypothetical protein